MKIEYNLLLQKIKKGDINAFEKLYAKNYESLCNFLLNYTHNKVIAEDAVQDTFLTLWEKRKELQINTSLKSYLYRLAYNKLMDKHRGNKRKENMLSSYYHTALIQALELDNSSKENRLKKLNNCIEELPTKCKQVFISCKINGLKRKQVADNLNVSTKTIEGHITNAFRLLRKCINY